MTGRKHREWTRIRTSVTTQGYSIRTGVGKKNVPILKDNFSRPIFIKTNTCSAGWNNVPRLDQISVSIGCLSLEEARFLGSSARDVWYSMSSSIRLSLDIRY